MAADLEDIVQHVAIEGTGEAGQTLFELAETAESAFEKIREAAEGGAGGLALFGGGALALVAGFAAAAYAVVEFTKVQSEHVLQEHALAEAFGTTLGGVRQLRQEFAQFGVSTTVLDRAMTRTAAGIANSLATIHQSQRTSQIAAESASEGIVDASINVESAQNKAADASTEWSQRLRGDAISVAEAYNKLAFSAQDMLAQVDNDMRSVTNATLGVEAAQLKLREFQSGKTDKVAEHDLQEKQLKQAVEDAKARETAARLQQTKDIIQTPLTQARNQLGVEQAGFKQHQDLDQSFIETSRASNDLAKALTAAKAAAEHGYEQQLHDLNAVANALEGKGGGINLSDVSVSRMREALQARTEQEKGSDFQATDVWAKLQEILKSNTINKEQQISLATQYGFIQRGSGGASAAEALQAFKNAPDLSKLPREASPAENQQVDTAQKTVAATTELGAKFSEFTENLATANGSIADFTQTVLRAIKSLGSGVSDIAGHAGGGEINGPGTSTSDSIVARLSHGEFVMRAAAVRAYGAGFMHSLNNMELPGFAMGGLVPSTVRMADGGAVPSTSVLNLTIDGHTFNGLRAPEDTAKKLSNFAIGRQTASTGEKPSWFK